MPSSRPKPHPLYPEPGAWVIGTRQRGLPEISPPSHPVKPGLTNDQVRDYVTYEGLGYCVCSFISPDKIKDMKLQELWVKAHRSLKDVVEYLDRSPKVPVKKPSMKRLTVKKGL